MTQKILLAIDLNEPHDSARAAAAAVRLAAHEGAVLHVINVVPDSGMAIVGAALGPEHAGQVVAEAKNELANFMADSGSDVAPENLHVVQGTVYDQIIRAANDIGADIIVVGAHRPELKDYLVGPNAARVVRHAAQSVFVVR